jgi:hypothetical protein
MTTQDLFPHMVNESASNVVTLLTMDSALGRAHMDKTLAGLALLTLTIARIFSWGHVAITPRLAAAGLEPALTPYDYYTISILCCQAQPI